MTDNRARMAVTRDRIPVPGWTVSPRERRRFAAEERQRRKLYYRLQCGHSTALPFDEHVRRAHQ